MKLKKILSLTLVLALAMTCFSACSKKDDSSDAKGVKVIDINLTEEEYAFGVDKNQPELLNQVNEFIEEIQNNGTFDEICNHYFGDGEKVAVKSAKLDDSKDQLVVATNAAFEPFEYTVGDTYYGIDMEIAQLLAKKLNKELVISNMNFEAVCLSVDQHKCDIAMAGLTVKPDREKQVTFSKSYYKASQKLVVKSDSEEFDGCKTAEDVTKILDSKNSSTKVGVQNGTTGQLFCKGDEEWEFAGFKFTTQGYANGALAMQDLLNGNIDYVVIDAAPAECISKSINAVQ